MNVYFIDRHIYGKRAIIDIIYINMRFAYTYYFILEKQFFIERMQILDRVRITLGDVHDTCEFLVVVN